MEVWKYGSVEESMEVWECGLVDRSTINDLRYTINKGN